MTSRIRELNGLIRNFTPHNSNSMCPNTITVIVISYANITPKQRDNPNVGTQIVLNVSRNYKVAEVKAARFRYAIIPRVNIKLICSFKWSIYA